MSGVSTDMSVTQGGDVTVNTTVTVGRPRFMILTTSGQCNCLVGLEREMSKSYSCYPKCLVDMARLRLEFNYLNSVCP